MIADREIGRRAVRERGNSFTFALRRDQPASRESMGLITVRLGMTIHSLLKLCACRFIYGVSNI